MMGGKDSYGSLITAMLANQGGMIGEMASILHPALADPLASLANMMTIVQTTLPELMGGMGLPFEPSPLVHEMFVKYSNGTKTEADLAMIDKGLDELFSHDFTEDDKSKLVDFMDMKDVFNKKGEPLPGKDIDLPVKTPKEWPTITVRRERESGESGENGKRERGHRFAATPGQPPFTPRAHSRARVRGRACYHHVRLAFRLGPTRPIASLPLSIPCTHPSHITTTLPLPPYLPHIPAQKPGRPGREDLQARVPGEGERRAGRQDR
jgi:hypothetical protein